MQQEQPFPTPIEGTSCRKRHHLHLSEPAESFPGNTGRTEMFREGRSPSLQPPPHGPWQETGLWPPSCALLEHQSTCAGNCCCHISLPRYCQVIMAFLLQPSISWHVPVPAIFALCRLLSVVLYCPLQRRAAFSLLSPSFTEFSNLFFAAHLSPWRLLLAIDFCIHVFLSYTLSPAIL